MTIVTSSNTENKVLAKREKFFSNIDNMTDEQINALSIKWHKMINRYTSFRGSLQLAQKLGVTLYELNQEIKSN